MRKSDFTLPTLDDLFSTQAERDDAKLERVRNIPLAELHPFKGHPFKVQNNEEMQRMIESIRKVGAITPALARPLPDGGYELISGHRRLAACQVLGVETMPVIVRELSDDEAVIAMVDANLQRETILPSEKAFAYKLKMEALSHQGKRTDLTSTQPVAKLRTGDIIGETLNESRETVRRFIRLTHLIPELLDLMDEGKIALMVGEALSYLGDEEQYAVLEECEMNDCTSSYAQAVEMKKRFQDRQLSAYDIGEILSREKANQKETIKIPSARLAGKIPSGYTLQQKEDFIVKAVDYYNKYRARQHDRDSR